MQDNDGVAKPIQITPILKESFSLYKDNFVFFLTISFLGSSISILEQILTAVGISLGWFGTIIMLAGTFISFWGHIALIFAIAQKASGQEVEIKDSFTTTKDKIWRFVGISALCFLLFAVGSLLFIIPGMYWGTIFALAGLVVVLEDTAFFDSFKRSKNLIQGNFWAIFLLYWVIFFITLPTWFFYKVDMPTTVRMFLMILFGVLYIPWSVSINVNIYNRLKKTKGDLERAEGEEVKKGGGCLGCLAMIGLFIVMIFLSSIWFKNVSGFIKTEKGSKVYEWVAKQFSPKLMKFSNDVSLQRPEGYMAFGGQYKDTTYVLCGFLDKEFLSIFAFEIPYDRLGISDIASLQLDSDVVWDKYYTYLNQQSPLNESKFKNMEKESLEIENINGRVWAKYVLKEKESEYQKSRKVWIYNYTLIDSGVVFVTHGYTLKEDEDATAKSNEVKRIISGFNF